MAEPAIALEGLERRYGERVALHGVTLRLEAGATLAVLGANGAGKTTLLRVLATLLRPHAGQADGAGLAAARATAGRCAGGWATWATIRCSTATSRGRENLAYQARLHGLEPARVAGAA